MRQNTDISFDQGPFLLHRNKGREHFEAEEFALARSELELAHQMRPDDPEVMYWLAMSYFRLDQHPDAERFFGRLLQQKPDVASLHVNRGIVLYKMNRTGEAEEEFRGALELEGAGNRPHLYLGLIHARRGEYRAAHGHFQKAGAEVMAARMRARLGSSGPQERPAEQTDPEDLLATTPLPIRVPEAHQTQATSAPPPPLAAPDVDLAEAVGAARPGRPLQGDAVYTPYGKYLVEIAISGSILIRRGALAGFVGEISFEPSAEEEDLLLARGKGRLVLVDESRRLTMVPLRGGTLHVEIGHFASCERGLSRELVSLGRKDGLGMRAVALTGNGIVTLATGGPPMLLAVDPDRPISIAADLIVGWAGSLEPSLVRQGTMEDRALRGAGGALKLRFHGRGHLLLDHRREEGT